MMDPMIEVDHLKKAYGTSQVVHNLSFRVEKGESFGFLGPNGAGKTTTIGMICGLIPPSEGEVRINGASLWLHPRKAKMDLGLVPQEFALYPALSAKENLIFFGRLYGLWGRALSSRVAYVLEAVRLSDRAHMIVSTYSNGMKRRLNLAVGLLHDPAVMVLDEPTVGIDAHSRHAILNSLKDLIQSGKTLLYCTHHLWEAEALCSRVAILDSGHIIAMDTPRKLILQHGTGLIRLELKHPVHDALLETLLRMGAARQSSDQYAGFQFQSTRPNVDLERLLKMAEQCGTTVRSAQLLEPTLETVFLNLTGRSVRD
jgi:linearmycin/streptolysin S transport system ATP-binding protein